MMSNQHNKLDDVEALSFNNLPSSSTSDIDHSATTLDDALNYSRKNETNNSGRLEDKRSNEKSLISDLFENETISFIDIDGKDDDGGGHVYSKQEEQNFAIKYSKCEISNNSLRRKLKSLLNSNNNNSNSSNNNNNNNNGSIYNHQKMSLIGKNKSNSAFNEKWTPKNNEENGHYLNNNQAKGDNDIITQLQHQQQSNNETNTIVGLKLLAIFSTIYFFMWSSSILSQAFNLTSYHYAGHFIRTSGFLQNPLIGLMVGVITTVIFQSSGAVTSVLVTIVGSGVLNVRQSIPIIMGANLGTSVTNTVVSLIVYRKKQNFEIAMTAGIVHDMYNMMSVVFMLPIELLFHPLEYCSIWMLNLFTINNNPEIINDTQLLNNSTISSPLSAPPSSSSSSSAATTSYINDKLQFLSHLVKPLVDLVIIIDKDKTQNLDPNYIVPGNETLVKKCCNSIKLSDNNNNNNETICLEKCFSLFSHLDFSDNIVCLLLLIIAMITLFTCLIFVVKVTKSLLGGKLLNWLAKLAKKEYKYPYKFFVGYLFILVGLIITVILHSSGVFTSMLVPLAGGDVLSLIQIYELTLGSNVGTTTTGIIAALSAQSKYPIETLQVALSHFLFNLAGILMFYSIPYTKLPIWASKRFGMLSAKNMMFSIGYLVIVFLLAPALTMAIYFSTN